MGDLARMERGPVEICKSACGRPHWFACDYGGGHQGGHAEAQGGSGCLSRDRDRGMGFTLVSGLAGSHREQRSLPVVRLVYAHRHRISRAGSLAERERCEERQVFRLQPYAAITGNTGSRALNLGIKRPSRRRLREDQRGSERLTLTRIYDSTVSEGLQEPQGVSRSRCQKRCDIGKPKT